MGLKVGNLTPHLGLNEFKLRRHPLKITNKIQTCNKFEGLMHIKTEKRKRILREICTFQLSRIRYWRMLI